MREPGFHFTTNPWIMIWSVFSLAFHLYFPDQSSLEDSSIYCWLVGLCTCVYAASFVRSRVCLPFCQHCLCVLPFASDSEDDGQLLCICENEKGTCVNGTCRGDLCFYTWVRGIEERGCFSAANYREQCLTSFESFFVHCCRENLCNALTTPPPNISQYPKPLLYNILTSHPWFSKNHCGT